MYPYPKHAKSESVGRGGVGSWESAFFTSSLAAFYAHLSLKMNVGGLQTYLHIRITWRALKK